MRFIRRRVASAVAIAVVAALPMSVGESQASTPEPEAMPLAVLAGSAPEGLAVTREGLAEYIRGRLDAISLEVEPGAESRARGREHGSSTADLLRGSAEAGAAQALIFDIDEEEGQLVTRMRLYGLDDATLFGIASEVAPDGALAQAADSGIESLLKRLGSDRTSLSRGQKLQLEELAAMSRSLELLDQGNRVRAWKTLSKLRGRGAGKMRRRIEREAEADPSDGPSELARLQLARGDVDAAWELLEPALGESETEPQDPALTLAAGEVQLERGRLRDARKYLEKAYEAAPDDPDAALGMARALALSNEPQAASRLFERAAELDTESAEPLELNARLAAETPEAKAQLFLEAGRRKARYLDTEGVQQSFGSAVRIDPELAPVTSDAAGDLYSAMRRHELATEAYRSVIELDGVSAERLEKLATAQHSMGDFEGAIGSYEKAIELEPERAALHEGIGRAHQETGAHALALEHLSTAAELETHSASPLVAMAEVQELMGDSAAALETYGKAKERGVIPARSLRSESGLLRTLGDDAAAEESLRAAIDLQPANPKLRTELAAMLRESGNTEAATEAERLAVDWTPEGPESQTEELASDEPDPASLVAVNEFEELVLSFGPPDPELRNTMLIGIREQAKPAEQAVAWLMPKRIALGELEERVLQAVSKFYPVTSREVLASQKEGLRTTADGLFDFQAKSSLNASSIATVNRQLATDAVFVASLSRGPSAQRACGDQAIRLELRRLAGTESETIDALGNGICLRGGLAVHGAWNYPAFALYAVLLALVVFPIVRGWGSVFVQFTFPENTKLNVGVRVSRRRRAPVKMDDSGDPTANQFKLQDRLNAGALFEKRLKGDKLVFDWLAARRKPYYVTVRGPMVDATSGALIGMYQEERQVLVKRGNQARVEFDMRIKEAAVEVRVVQNRQPSASASVSLEGIKESLRYSNGKPTYHYLDIGRYALLIAGPDRVLRAPLEITALAPVHKTIDLDDEHLLVFKDCPDAVELYLAGDHEAVADTLEAAGQLESANQLRAQLYKAAGNTTAAAEALEKVGKLDEAARLHAQSGDHDRAATLLQEAGDTIAAARAHREAGDIPAAARAFEAAEDWSSAIECYRQLQEPEGLLNALERGQSYFEAGQRAEESQQTQRAMHNYQRLTFRDTEYGEACLRMARILESQNEPELARERYADAAQALEDEMPLDAHFRFAELLEEEGQIDQAISALESIRRRNHEYTHAKTKLEELRKTAESQAQAPKQGSVQPSAGDRYEIVSELGRGGMGVVYRATDTHLGRVIALKKLPENLKDHPTAVELFLREARSAAVLNHTNVVTVYDAGQDGDNYFISMECLEGIPLDALLKEHGRLSARDACLLGLQAANGLAYAHSQRIIHRDIKPSNLFYTSDRTVKIMDFGLAKAVEEVRKNASMIAGTPYYMAPEQALGEVVDHRADIYALGVTIYQLATGKVPFASGDVTYHHRHTPPPDPRELADGIPDALAELLLEMLAKDPDHRVQNASEVSERLLAAASSTS